MRHGGGAEHGGVRDPSTNLMIDTFRRVSRLASSLGLHGGLPGGLEAFARRDRRRRAGEEARRRNPAALFY